MKLMRANPPVSPGTQSEKFTALNTTTYHRIVTKTGIQYTTRWNQPTTKLEKKESSGRIHPNI
jgi:hypothetical protein